MTTNFTTRIISISEVNGHDHLPLYRRVSGHDHYPL
jgi:hypothetical protein